jgi:hypothetical protein
MQPSVIMSHHHHNARPIIDPQSTEPKAVISLACCTGSTALPTSLRCPVPHSPTLHRDYFLIPANYAAIARTSPLVARFGELLRKIWNPRNFKGQVRWAYVRGWLGSWLGERLGLVCRHRSHGVPPQTRKSGSGRKLMGLVRRPAGRWACEA